MYDPCDYVEPVVMGQVQEPPPAPPPPPPPPPKPPERPTS